MRGLRVDPNEWATSGYKVKDVLLKWCLKIRKSKL